MKKRDLFWVIERDGAEYQGVILHMPKSGTLETIWTGEKLDVREKAYAETAHALRRKLGIGVNKHVRPERRTE